MQIVRDLNLDKDGIVLIAHLTYSSGKNAFVKYDEGGNEMDILKAKMFEVNQNCVVKNANIVFFRNDFSKINMLEDSQTKIFFDVAPMAVACICPTKDDNLYIDRIV